MTNQDQVKAFGELADALDKFADQEAARLIESEDFPLEKIRQAAQLAKDHKALAELWEKPLKTGEFISIEKAIGISKNYIDKFGTNPDPNAQPTTPDNQRLPLFPKIMWLVDAKKLRKITKVRTKNGLEANLIRVYPGINISETDSKENNFTFIFAAQDKDGNLIKNSDMDDDSKAELIDDETGGIVEGASVLEEIGTCNPCDELGSFMLKRPIHGK